jgi:hypothetical protein
MSTNMDPRDGREEGSGLTSAEYRARLLHKLNCLIAVLEVAINKISRTLEGPPERVDRMLKIRANLENTLAICRRARTTLDRKTVAGPAAAGTTAIAPVPSSQRSARTERMSYRDYVELMSVEEYRKFKRLAPIDERELRTLDLDGLISRLQD